MLKRTLIAALLATSPAVAAPTIHTALPQPNLPDSAEPRDYLRAASIAVREHNAGLAEEALEQAQTRLLSRSTALFATHAASDDTTVQLITAARAALADGSWQRCADLIQGAMIP